MKLLHSIKILPAILFGFLTYKTLKLYLTRRKYRNIPGPKSKGVVGFFFGEYFTISEFLAEKRIIHELQLQWTKQYGPIYVYQFFDKFICVSNEHECIKRILIDEDLPKSEDLVRLVGYPFGERLIGVGLVTEVDKEKWRKRRALFNNGFKKDVLSECVNEFNAKGNIFIQKLNSLCNRNEPICLLNELNRVTLDAIAKIAFDINTDSINDENSKLNYHITKGLESVTLMMSDPLSQLKPSKRKLINEIKKSIKELRNYCSKIFDEKINELEESGNLSNNIISAILKSAKTLNDLEYETLIDDFLTFFIAGQETTANALAFCIFELGQNEKILKKLKEEVDSILGQKSEITNEDLSKLVYTGAVFKESMRKWPPAPATFRKLNKDLVMLGHNIPKDTWFCISPFQLGRNSKYFPESESFIPERFIESDPFYKLNMINSYTYFPFSLGPRNCIGQNFAKLEGKLILAKFIQHFDFKLDPNQSLCVAELATLRPKDGAKVFLSSKF